jgi:hypothetical protein
VNAALWTEEAMDSNTARVNLGRVIIGAAFLVWGLLLTLNQTGVVHVRRVGALWPLILVALGAGKIAGSDSRRGLRSGMWLLVIGLWFALNEFTVFGYHDTWPLLLVAVGVMIVWDVIAGYGAARSATEGENG